MKVMYLHWTRYGQLTFVFQFILAALAIAPSVHADFTVFSVGGTSAPASIQPTVDAFRAALGDPLNGNNPGPLSGGRREINWDGGGSTVASPVGTPMTTFQNSRGGTFTTPGTGFVQTPLDDVALTGIQASYETTFGTFSPVRIFTPLGSNITDATFSIPGSGGLVPATVSGFGAVFSDVDLADTTSLEFFDTSGASLFTVSAPQGTGPDASLSFVGALADAGEQIARVRITAGNMPLGAADSNGNPVDVVVMDDFFYSEPIPEPATITLVACVLLAGVIRNFRRWS
jgi:hypothetical protein